MLQDSRPFNLTIGQRFRTGGLLQKKSKLMLDNFCPLNQENKRNHLLFLFDNLYDKICWFQSKFLKSLECIK